MRTKTWNNTTFTQIPDGGDVNWPLLTNFLVALADNAQTISAQKNAIRTATSSPVTVSAATDCVVITDLSSPGAVTVNLPAGANGQIFVIVDGAGDASSNNITINPNGADTISGAASLVINLSGGGYKLQYSSTGTDWKIIETIGTPGLTRTSADQGSNRLQNKDLDDASTKIVDTSDTTKKIAFDAGGTTATTTTIAAAQTANRTVTLPDATDTLMGKATTDAMTNKDFQGGTATDSSRITVPKDTTANLAALTRKQATILYDTTTDQLKADDGTNLVIVTSDSANLLQNLSIASSVGSNALTIELKDKDGNNPSIQSPVRIGFNNATLTTGTYSIVKLTSAASLVVDSGSTLGHRSGVDEVAYIYAINNAGTIEPAISSRLFDEGGLISTTAIGVSGTADSRTVMYSTTARSNVSFRLVGRIISNQTVAGTYGSAPTSTRPYNFSQVLSAMFTPWITYTPTVSASTSNPTIQSGVTTAYWRRVFDCMEIAYYYGQTSSAGLASGTGVYFWSIPTGFTINTTITPTPLTVASDAKQFNSVVGSAGAYSGIRSTSASGVVKIYNSTNLCLHLHEGGTSHQAFGSTDYGFGGSNTIQYSFRAMIPITEFAL